jgi:hypothetical protein
MDKQHILNEIRRTAEANGGEPLGRQRFFNETGIKESDWLGKWWSRWSAVVEEAGFTPLTRQGKNDRTNAIRKVAELTRRLGKIPTVPEMRLEKKTDAQFPNTSSLLRVAAKDGLLEELLDFCRIQPGYEDVELILKTTPARAEPKELPEQPDGKLQYGYVYLILSSRKYKIGYSKAALSRASVVSNLSPEGGEIIHLIRTDDMRGIEAYWHNRFTEKRGNGEWFALSSSDIAAFKRRKFM